MNQFPENKVVANEIDHFNHYLVPNSDIYDAKFFNIETVGHIQKECAKLLTGLYPDNQRVVVSVENILSVMDSVYQQRPHVNINELIKMVISFIVQHIKIEYETIENNNKLNIDVLLYAEDYGIRRIPIIKLNEKKFRRSYNTFDLRY